MASPENHPTPPLHVVAMPYPGRGHINPMLNLCKAVAERRSDILVTIVVTEEWLGLIGSMSKPPNMSFASIPNVVPLERVRGDDIYGFARAVMTKMEEPFERLLDEQRLPAPAVIISDAFLSWVAEVAGRRNIPLAYLWTMSASQKSKSSIYNIAPASLYFKARDIINSTSTYTNDTDEYYSKWLDLQPPSSVLYVSLGSFLYVSKTQMDEIAIGLQKSGVRFLWVAREKSRLQEMCGEKGLVVDWCDQLRVLCHPSVGGFWSHCGWNSTKDAVLAGVPVLTSPIIMDQLPNAKAIIEDWKIGWRISKREFSEENLVKGGEIANIVERFMNLESPERKELTRNARELKKICDIEFAIGGSLETNVDSFVRSILSEATRATLRNQVTAKAIGRSPLPYIKDSNFGEEDKRKEGLGENQGGSVLPLEEKLGMKPRTSKSTLTCSQKSRGNECMIRGIMRDKGSEGTLMLSKEHPPSHGRVPYELLKASPRGAEEHPMIFYDARRQV
ncbi:hypothetical protein DH2020_000555 [Rehmannia glutinosa]|uniref:UDP-glycosyltransferase n=1 Tax=Rehmannia glutinosa TaxID=99300 RepID=A0ABR0XX50_REHGL